MGSYTGAIGSVVILSYARTHAHTHSSPPQDWNSGIAFKGILWMTHSFTLGVSKECSRWHCGNLNPEIKVHTLNRHAPSLLPRSHVSLRLHYYKTKATKWMSLMPTLLQKGPKTGLPPEWPVCPISISLKPGVLFWEHSDQGCVSTSYSALSLSIC